MWESFIRTIRPFAMLRVARQNLACAMLRNFGNSQWYRTSYSTCTLQAKLFTLFLQGLYNMLKLNKVINLA